MTSTQNETIIFQYTYSVFQINTFETAFRVQTFAIIQSKSYNVFNESKNVLKQP